MGPLVDWNSTPNFVQVINQDRIELRANKDGSLAEIVSVSEQGELAKYSSTKELQQTIKSFCNRLPPEVAARMKLVVVADTNLNPKELEQFKSEIKVEINLSNGGSKTIPAISLR